MPHALAGLLLRPSDSHAARHGRTVRPKAFWGGLADVDRNLHGLTLPATCCCACAVPAAYRRMVPCTIVVAEKQKVVWVHAQGPRGSTSWHGYSWVFQCSCFYSLVPKASGPGVRWSGGGIFNTSSALDRLDPGVLRSLVLFGRTLNVARLDLFAIRLGVKVDCLPGCWLLPLLSHRCSLSLAYGLAGTIRAPTLRLITCNTRAKSPIKPYQVRESP